MKPILFIHIPKTAGTSLNASAETCFGVDTVERDYGPDAPHTSALVKEYIYGPETVDQFAFHEAFRSSGKKWLAGHFAAERYLQFLGCENTISFVREPVDRVISEYLYRRRSQGLEQSFEDFYRSPDETNKQFRFIGQVPWRTFHFVGTQERYGEGLLHLGETLGIAIEAQTKNRRTDSRHESISAEERQDIAKWNARDIEFYADVSNYMEQQFAARQAGQAFCYHDIGFVPGVHAIGWAFFEASNDPVDVELYVDGSLVHTVRASEHRPELHGIGVPRGGCVGFRFVLSEYRNAKSVKLRARETGQTLLNWTPDN